MLISMICSISSSLLNVLSIFLIEIYVSIFFNLNPCFLTNSELITNHIILLSNSTSTIILSCISVLSKLIFTITSLNNFSSTVFLIFFDFFFSFSSLKIVFLSFLGSTQFGIPAYITQLVSI